MKRLFALLLAGAALQPIAHAQPASLEKASSASEQLFNTPPPGALPSNVYISLPANNKFWLELTTLSQVSQLPNLDSLFSIVKANLMPLMDTLAADAASRRINFDMTNQPVRFQIITHPDFSPAFTTINGELNQLKINQDTIRIQFSKQQPAFATLLVNSLQDLFAMPPGKGAEISRAIDTLYQQKVYSNKKHSSQFEFVGEYDMANGNKSLSSKYKLQSKGYPYLQLSANPGLGYVRGAVLPSIAMGASVNFIKNYSREKSHISLGVYWEPQFSFTKNLDNKVKTSRHDFLSIAFQEMPASTPKGFSILNHMSVGYLLNNRGDVFEKNTFKLGAPGIQNGRLHIVPEFYFNDFFKNFSPGVRMVISLTQ